MTGTTSTTPPDVDVARFPASGGEHDDTDVCHVAPDVEDDENEDDEAGYGYGV
jgi:hypothetical protein